MTKICTKCKKEKNIRDFGFSRLNIRRSECKECQKEYNRTYRMNNKEKVKEWAANKVGKNKIYRASNREKRNEYLKEWYRKNPDKKREQKYRHRYGVTLEGYEALFEQQGGRCAICKTTEAGRKNSKYFVIDHCHRTGKIRGLLCHNCNVLLSRAKEDIAILKNAITYFELVED